MLIISFAWTFAAFEAGFKTCTRRSWPAEYAARFRAGMICQGWDRVARNGGRSHGLIWLTVKPYKESTADMPEEDYENEGLGWMERNGLLIRGMAPVAFWDNWKKAAEDVYVVRFKKIEKPAGLFYSILGLPNV